MSKYSAIHTGLLKKRNSVLPFLILFLKPLFLLVLLNFVFSSKLFADDPGIAKVRLIQQNDTSYIFEVDIPQAFLGSFREPVLPQGFTITTPEREFQSGWVTLKAKIISPKRGFQPDDVILLPWARNAVDITAQWLDGKTFKGFFARTMNGILVPLNQVMSVQLSTKEVIKSYFVSGLKHWSFNLVHLLFILALVIAVPKRKGYSLLLAFSIGQMTAMVLAELHIFAHELLFADLILLLLTLYIAYSLLRSKEPKQLPLLVFFSAFLHALSFGYELHAEDLLMVQRIQAMFAFNVAIDLGNFIVATVLLIAISGIRKWQKPGSFLPVLTGSLSVFCILLIFNDNILAGRKQILDFQASEQEILVQTRANSPLIGNNAIAKSKGFMSTPIMVLLSVEPYETRKEILIAGSEVYNILGMNEAAQTFPIETQHEIKRRLEKLINASDTTFINNKINRAQKVLVNFVTLGKGGVSIKETAVEESITNAIIGISVNYLTPDFPDSIQFNWHLFPESGQIDLSLVDPHATFAGLITPSDNAVKWKSRIKGFKLPAIEPIEVKNEAIAIVSYLIWLILGIVSLRQWFTERSLLHKTSVKIVLISILILGFILFPFVRPALGITALSHSKPSSEKGEVILNDLLSNVYRAFDRKQENLVYDLLAASQWLWKTAEVRGQPLMK